MPGISFMTGEEEVIMRAGFFIRNIKSMLLASFSTIDRAELRTYEWDGIMPRAEWHGWCELFGSPYSVVFDTGEQVVEGGWIDIRHLGRIAINAKVTAAAGINGSAILFFEGAMSLYDTMIRDMPTDMQMIANVVESVETETHGVIDIQKWNYYRFNKLVNNSNGAITLRLITHDGVRPADLPPGTGV